MKIDINDLPSRIFEAVEKNTDNTPRPHLGASIIGHPCDRYIWLSFRWIMREKFSGRMLNLFKRGQLEEQQVIYNLRLAGIKIDEIDQKTKKQFSFSDGHFAGSCDGIINSGITESPTKRHIFECKTASHKSFSDLAINGIQKSKPQHYAQLNIYMLKLEIDRAIYLCVNKNDDDIYVERVKLDKEFALKLVEKAQRIISSDRIPEALSVDKTWFQCRFCSSYDFCHKAAIPQEVHCRTCSNITFNRDGTAHCQHWDSEVPTDAQLHGCDHHIIHPDILQIPMEFKDGHVQWKVGDVWVKNGEAARDVFTSAEILADAKGCASMIGDEFAQDTRMELGARVVNYEV